MSKKGKKAKQEARDEAAIQAYLDVIALLALSQTSHEEVTKMNIHKLASVGALVAFAAAVLGQTIFGHSGLELVAGGLFLHAGADLLEDVLS